MNSNIVDWAEWPKPRRGKIPPSLARYEERLKRILGPSKPGKKVRRLPPTAVQLAREGYKTREFKNLVIDLFGSTPEEGLLYEPTDTLALLLYKSGYYHALIAGESTRPYRHRIADRVQYGQRERHTMWLLGGCEFARSFRILDFSVESFTDGQLMRSGPDRRIYKDTSILGWGDRGVRQNRWWFVLREDVANGWVGKQEWEALEKKKWDEAAPERKKKEADLDELLEKYGLRKKERTTATKPRGEFVQFREIASSRSVRADASTFGSRPEQIDPLQAAILILSLYNDNFFDVPAMVAIDPGWRIDWLKRTRTSSEPEYQVTEKEWPKFEAFLRIAERAICLTPHLDLQPRFSIAAERYLRATYATGYSFFSELRADSHTWDEVTGEEVIVRERHTDERSLQEDVLLNYFLALGTLAGEQIRGGIPRASEQASSANADPRTKEPKNPAARVASLIGRDDDEEKWIRLFLTSLYLDRSDIVHEGHLQRKPADLRILRRCCQRALGMVITLSAAAKNFGDVEKIICGDSNPDKRERVDRARRELYGLLADRSRLDQWKSPERGWR